MSTRKDKKQQLFPEQKELWEEEWENMPEYSNREIKPYKTIKVHFKTKEDYVQFAKLISQNLTEKTKSIWHPKLLKGLYYSKLRYSDES